MSGQALVTIAGKEWLTDVALLPWELSQGLGGVPELPAGSGMLFDLGFEQTIHVTTVPMLFPLDIAFLAGDMTVTELYRGIDPGYIVNSLHPARYFLEVNAGELADVETGSRAEVNLLLLENGAEAPDWIPTMFGLIGFLVIGAFMITIVRDFTGKTFEDDENKPALLPQTPNKVRQPRQSVHDTDLELLPDSPEYLAYTIDDIGYREKIDTAFQRAISRARRIRQ